MPYEIVRSADQFCVIKQGTSERLGCHPTEAKARRQMAALYANEPEAKAGGTADLPDSAFAYIEPGCDKTDGKTVDRCRHFPIHDAAHVRNALARLSQSPFGEKARPKVEAAAKKMGIGEPAGKALFDMKAEPLTERKMDRWLGGEIPRPILVVPFTGPLPGGKAGLDLDGEYFDDVTDLYGPFAGLRASRWREMDWHHDDAGVPPKSSGGPVSMKGALIGEIELHEDPDEDGLWADWWIKQGQARRQLIAARRVTLIEQRGEPIFGSSQAIYKQKADDGHIEVWPLYRHTATTSPQNTHAVIPPLKGLLDALTPDDLSSGAMTALLVGLSELVPDLRATFSEAAADPLPSDSEPAAKSGRVLAKSKEQRLRDAFDESISRLVSVLNEIVGAKEEPTPEVETQRGD